VIHQGLELEPRLQKNLDEMSKASGLNPEMVLQDNSTTMAANSTGSAVTSSTVSSNVSSTQNTTEGLSSKLQNGTTSTITAATIGPKAEAVIKEVNLPDSERVVEEEIEIVETNLVNFENYFNKLQ